MASLHAHAPPPLIRQPQPMASGSCTDVAVGGSQREVCGTQERLRIFLNFLLTPFFFSYLSNHFLWLERHRPEMNSDRGRVRTGGMPLLDGIKMKDNEISGPSLPRQPEKVTKRR